MQTAIIACLIGIIQIKFNLCVGGHPFDRFGEGIVVGFVDKGEKKSKHTFV